MGTHPVGRDIGFVTAYKEGTESEANRPSYLPMGSEEEEERQQQVAAQHTKELEQWQGLKT